MIILIYLNSQSNRNSVLGSALGERGHNVTILSPYEVKTSSIGVNYILVENLFNGFEEMGKEESEAIVKNSPFIEHWQLHVIFEAICSSK